MSRTLSPLDPGSKSDCSRKRTRAQVVSFEPGNSDLPGEQIQNMPHRISDTVH